MNNNFPPVFVTYGWCRNGYTVVKSLGRNGIKVNVGDNSKFAMSRFSRYCKEFTLLPDLFLEQEGYFEEVCKALRKTGSKVLLPCHEDMEIFIKYKDRLPQGTFTALPDYDLYQKIEDKLGCVQLAQKYDCPVPETIEIKKASELEQFQNNSLWPKVVKTRIGNGSKGVRIVSNYDKMINAFNYFVETYKLSSERYPVIQEYLSGPIAFVEVLYNKGKCIAISSTKPLRHKNIDTNNNATLRKTADYENLMKTAKKFMDKLGWHGIAQLEFIPNSRGVYKLSEVNARPWGSIAVPVYSGVDYPWLWYLTAINEVGNVLIRPSKEVYCRWILGECMAFVEYLKARQIKNAFKIFCPVKNCYHDDFSLNDPFVLFGEGLDYFTKLIKSGGNSNPVTEGMIR